MGEISLDQLIESAAEELCSSGQYSSADEAIDSLINLFED